MEIKLAAYEGPLDLLLRLIQRNEIDIYDIPIAELTEQYLAEVREIRGQRAEGRGQRAESTAEIIPLGEDGSNVPNDENSVQYTMDQISEFVLMAATLLEIKSRMLLPKPKNEAEDIEEEDPREALVQKLLAYQEAQALAAELNRISPPGLRLSGAGDTKLLEEIEADIDSQTPIMEGVDLSQIWAIFTDVMSRRAARRDPIRAGFGAMQRERFTIPEKIAHIRQRIQMEGHVRLSMLFEYCRTRIEMVVTFLALLEMMRQGMVKTRQNRAFEDVYCESA